MALSFLQISVVLLSSSLLAFARSLLLAFSRERMSFAQH